MLKTAVAASLLMMKTAVAFYEFEAYDASMITFTALLLAAVAAFAGSLVPRRSILSLL